MIWFVAWVNKSDERKRGLLLDGYRREEAQEVADVRNAMTNYDEVYWVVPQPPADPASVKCPRCQGKGYVKPTVKDRHKRALAEARALKELEER